jgi:hypothetical protein
MGRLLRFGLLSGELARSTAIGTARQWSAGKPLDIVRLACEPLAHHRPYDFTGSGLMVRARDLGLAVAFGKGLRSPPPETIVLHRKLIGTFLMCAKPHAPVNVRAAIEKYL